MAVALFTCRGVRRGLGRTKDTEALFTRMGLGRTKGTVALFLRREICRERGGEGGGGGAGEYLS